MDTQKQRHNLRENAGQTFQLYNINSHLIGGIFHTFQLQFNNSPANQIKKTLHLTLCNYQSFFFTTVPVCQEMVLFLPYLSMLEIISHFHFINNDKIKEILIPVTSSITIETIWTSLHCTIDETKKHSLLEFLCLSFVFA